MDDAAPLLMASGACFVVTVALRMSPSPVLIGSLPIWGLFAALSVISAIGAALCLLLEELEWGEVSPSTAVRAEPSPTDRPVIAPTPRPPPPSPLAFAASGRSRPRARTRSVAPPWLEAAEDREISLSMATSEMYESEVPDVRRRRAPATEASPAEAIAEIDRLWWDLERLRHTGRRGLPG
ncbi:MAG: hypothetical protein L3K06_02165 [Thermoplasmata archaeon]|nr:hypothetical protein [Thermoplasmata archaeon]MCI4354153.1 hypothetical protein [Thermoplasmata archaeon]